jgi:hypothetical protein
MKEAGVWVRYKKEYKSTTNSDHKKPIYVHELKQDLQHKSLTKLMCKTLMLEHQKAGCIWRW